MSRGAFRPETRKTPPERGFSEEAHTGFEPVLPPFFSVASNLVAEDTNTCPVFQVPGECADIFVHVETSG
jgi:hypothetical protein